MLPFRTTIVLGVSVFFSVNIAFFSETNVLVLRQRNLESDNIQMVQPVEPTIVLAAAENTDLRLPPDHVFLAWKQAHSVGALRDNPHNRTYMVAEYSCPGQAGNLLHNFTSTMLQAILTNRTFLWKYWISDERRSAGKNLPDECDRVLHRAEWIPSYDEWSQKLNLPEPHYTARNMHLSTNITDISSHQVILPGMLWGLEQKDFDLWNGLLFLEKNQTAKLLSLLYNINVHKDERVPLLYSQGVAYLYGMLFFESFSLTEGLLETVQNDLNAVQRYAPNGHLGEPHKDIFTVGIHSRHHLSSDDGGDVYEEIQCLDWLISKRGENSSNCAVFIMADRPTTIQKINNHLQQTTNCAAVSVSPPDLPTGESKWNLNGAVVGEHGPFAGAGFFRDLALVSMAGSGFSGSARSSSALVFEFIEYKRRREAWQYDQSLLEPLHRCYFRDTPAIACDGSRTMKTSCLEPQSALIV